MTDTQKENELELVLKAAMPNESFIITRVHDDAWLRPRITWGDDVLGMARKIVEALGHDKIDFRDDVDTSDPYEAADDIIDDPGCDSCGHGAVIVLRGVFR